MKGVLKTEIEMDLVHNGDEIIIRKILYPCLKDFGRIISLGKDGSTIMTEQKSKLQTARNKSLNNNLGIFTLTKRLGCTCLVIYTLKQ